MSSKLLYCFLFFIAFETAGSARICIFSMIPNPFSYRSGFDFLIESLIDKGHEVTLFSNFPYKSGRVKHVTSKSAISHMDNFYDFISPLEWRLKGKHSLMWDMYPILSLDVCGLILQSEETQEWIKTAKKYDLFIVDSLWNECGIGLSHIFKAKLVLFNFHSNIRPWNIDAFGGAVETSWIPDIQYDTSVPMTFFQRLSSALRAIRWQLYRKSFTLYQTRKFFRKFLSLPEFPAIGEIEGNASLFLTNSHFSEEYARSLPPIIVPVGGIHIKKTSDKSYDKLGIKKEFILVNIGCSPDTVRTLRNESFERILTAVESTNDLIEFIFLGIDLPEIRGPKNAGGRTQFFRECEPRFVSYLLAHPLIKGFVTHGDILDLQEAIYHAVPVLVLPVAFDQDANAERVERLERGIRLEITSLGENDLALALQALVKNETFKSNMIRASESFRDRPMQPMDLALWWIEYVLRRSDTSELKPLGLYQPWYVRRSLDVWCSLFCLAGVGIFIASLLISKYIMSRRRYAKTGAAKKD